MLTLYNIAPGNPTVKEMLRKTSICIAVLGLSSGVLSCRKGAIATADRATVKPVSEAISASDNLYAQRADLVKVRQAIVELRQAQADDQANYDVAWRLSKYNYYLGSHSTESTEQTKAFHEGIESGKLAIRLQPDKPDGHFWLGANYGGNAQISTLAGLAEVDDIKQEMETVLKINERYEAGSAYMVLGEVYLDAPKLLGGDVNKAVGYLEKGIKVGPDNEMMRAKLAAAYVEAHRNEDARKQIETLMAMKPAPDYKPEYDDAIAEAKKIQEQIK